MSIKSLSIIYLVDVYIKLSVSTVVTAPLHKTEDPQKFKNLNNFVRHDVHGTFWDKTFLAKFK